MLDTSSDLAVRGGAPEVCEPGTPLTYRDIDVYRIDSAGASSYPRVTGAGGSAYEVSAVGGVLASTQAGGSVY